MQSLPPASYQALAKLELPASYVCVVRDVDSDSYRIDATQDLAGFIEQVLAERDGDFGIELLAIVQASDLAAFEDLLHERHDAALGGEWLSLDAYQIRELRGSFLQINAFHSQYLNARQHKALASAAAAVGTGKRAADEPSHVSLGSLLSNSRSAASDSPAALTQYNKPAARSVIAVKKSNDAAAKQPRRPIRTRYELWNQEKPPARGGLRHGIDDKISDFMVNHPGLVIAIILLIALIAWFTLESRWVNPYAIR